MRHPTAWVAILVAFLMATGGLVALHSSSPSEPSATPSSAEIRALEQSPAPPLPQLFKPVTGFSSLLSDSAPFYGLTTEQISAINAWYSQLSPAERTLLHADGDQHVLPNASVLAEFGLTTAGYNFYCVGSSLLAGSLLGAGLGSLAGPAGTAIGTLVGFIAGGVGAYYECNEAANAINALGKQYQVWAEAQATALGNEVNLTNAEFGSIASALNLSTVGWERAADHAALEQLGSPSFNISQDLYDSGIYANLAPVASAYEQEIADILVAQISAMNGAGYTNEYYNAVNPNFQWLQQSGATYSAASDVVPEAGSASVTGTGFALSSFGTGEVFIPGSQPDQPNGMVLECDTQIGTCPSSIHFLNEETHRWSNLTTQDCSSNSGAESYMESCNLGYPGMSAYTYYVAAATCSECTLFIPGGQVAPTSATAGWTVGGMIADAPTSSNGEEYNESVLLSAPLEMDYTCHTGSGACALNPTPVTFAEKTQYTEMSTYLTTWLAAIEWQAAQNAEAYWQFLHNAGFSSTSSIPPDCIIPAPYVVLPSSVNETDLNASEWYSLYLASLEGMANFYNTTLSGTSFCGTQAVQQWSMGDTVWGNLYLNATGFIYLNNGTAPIAVNGTALPSERLSNRTTWAIGNTTYGGMHVTGPQQLLLMPTLATVSIPVGRLYEVPANDPIQVYAVQSGVQITANGNGTNVTIGNAPLVFRPMTLQPGDAIYLSSCMVGGQAQANCTAAVQTLNVTIANITCTGPCKQNANQGGTFGGLPNPFAWLASLFSGLLGGGPLGQLLGSLVAAFVILVVILVLVYVVYRVATGKRSGGGGGQVLVVGGGGR